MAAGTLRVEVLSWVSRFVGGDGSTRRVFDEPLPEDPTVRGVLLGLTGRFPELARALWRDQDIGEHIEVLVNDAVLGVDHGLDSPVGPGDRITLVGQFIGGGAWS